METMRKVADREGCSGFCQPSLARLVPHRSVHGTAGGKIEAPAAPGLTPLHAPAWLAANNQQPSVKI